MLQAEGPPVPIFSDQGSYTDSDQISDADCDLSGFDPELVRAYEEYADGYFRKLWEALNEHFGLPQTPDPTRLD